MVDVDVAVIGGGVIGLSCAAALVGRGRSVVLFERHKSFGQETSSRNSEVIHAGIYYPAGSLKAQLCVAGRRQLYALAEAHGIPCSKCGKVIVATEEKEIPSLEALLAKGQANGVEGLTLLGPDEVAEIEPHVRAVAGLYSPETGIIDSHQLMACFARAAEAHDADLVYGAEVIGLDPIGDGWQVRYRDSQEEGAIATTAVVNAAGLLAQTVMALAGLDVEALGVPGHFAKGEYFALTGSARKKIRGLVYPSPEANLVGLGIHTVVDLGGGVKLGPNAFYVDELEYDVDPAHRSEFFESARQYLPWLSEEDLVPDMSGIRPKLAGPGEGVRDFYIAEETTNGAPGLINLAGMESPGLTASPAIGDYVAELLS